MSRDVDEVVDAVIETVAAVAPDVRAGLPGRRLTQAGRNPSGETVMAADVHADELFFEALGAVDGVGEYGSEEREAVADVGEGVSVAIDPLDGSSNLKSNNAMGTVVGVYDAPLPASGRDLLAAGYVLYGPITTFTVARGDEPGNPDSATVTEYLVEGGQMEPVREDHRLPADPTVYGFGGRVPDWPADFEGYAREIEQELKLRYGGAMIADVNQVMTYGGIFAYPALESAEHGKLRLQFEGAPIGYVVEAAGGASSDGERSLLDVDPDELHQRVPVHVGNEALIDRLEAALD